MLDLILPILPIVLVVIILLGILASGYVKAPPDKAYIISGLRKEPKILIGCSGIKWPYLEQKDSLLYAAIQQEIKEKEELQIAQQHEKGRRA